MNWSLREGMDLSMAGTSIVLGWIETAMVVARFVRLSGISIIVSAGGS